MHTCCVILRTHQAFYEIAWRNRRPIVFCFSTYDRKTHGLLYFILRQQRRVGRITSVVFFFSTHNTRVIIDRSGTGRGEGRRWRHTIFFFPLVHVKQTKRVYNTVYTVYGRRVMGQHTTLIVFGHGIRMFVLSHVVFFRPCTIAVVF